MTKMTVPTATSKQCQFSNCRLIKALRTISIT